MTETRMAALFGFALWLMDSWHDGRNCALAGREPYGPGACEPCSLDILLSA